MKLLLLIIIFLLLIYYLELRYKIEISDNKEFSYKILIPFYIWYNKNII